MAGIIQSNQTGGKLMTPQDVESHLHLQPQQVNQLKAIVVAGMKVMFSPQTHQLLLQQLQGPGPIAQKLGAGIAGLMGLLLSESKNSLPHQLLIPAGMVLIAQAADFLQKAGQAITNADIASATEIFTHTMLKSANLDPNKVLAAAGGAKPPAAAPAQPAMPPAQPAPQPPQGV